MAPGPGKYEEAVNDACASAGATEVALLVLDGEKGPGFCCRASYNTRLKIPALLRFVADQVEDENLNLRKEYDAD